MSSVQLNLDPVDTGACFNVQPRPTSPIEEAKSLVKRYQQSLLSIGSSVIAANSLICELKKLCVHDLYLGMEGLCLLLKLDIEDFQSTLLKEIKIIFHGNFSTEVLTDSAYLKMFELENIINEVIVQHIRFDRSIKVLEGLIDLFQDILEHLWLMPYLQSNSALIPIKERCGPDAEKHLVAEWGPLMKRNLKRYANFRTRFEEALVLAKMTTSLSDSEVIHYIKSNLNHFQPPDSLSYVILGILGNLYFIGQFYTRAIKYYAEALAYLDKHTQSTFFNDSINLINFFRISILTQLGISCAALEDYKAALNFCEKSWDYTRELNREEKLRADADINASMGKIFSLQKKYSEAIPYFLKQFDLTNELNDPDAQNAVCCALVEAYTSLGQPDKAQQYEEKLAELAAQDLPPETRLASALEKIKGFLDRKQDTRNDENQSLDALKECVSLSRAVIPMLSSLGEEHLNRSREGFCLLLKLDDENLRQIVLEELRHLIHCNFSLDTDQESYQLLADLEANVSETISQLISKQPQPNLISLLELHQSILEQLWFLPYFCEKNTLSITLKQKNLIKTRAAAWIKLIEHDKDLESTLITSQQLLSKLTIPLPRAVEEFCASFQSEHFAQPFAAFDGLSLFHCSARNYLKAKSYCLEALDLIKTYKKQPKRLNLPPEFIDTRLKYHLPYLEAHFLSRLGNISIQLGEPEIASKYYQKSKKLEPTLNEKEKLKLKLHIYRDEGNAFYEQGRYNKAIQSYLKQLDAAKQLEDQTALRHAYHQIGDAYLASREYQKGADYFSLELASASDLSDQAAIQNQLGLAYTQLKQFAKAREYYTTALEIADREGFAKIARAVRFRLGLNEQFLGNFQQALDHYTALLTLCTQSHLLEDRITYLNNIATIYLNVGDYKRAKKFFKKCLTIAEEIELPEFIESSCLNLYNAYFNLYNPEKATFYLKKLAKQIANKKKLPLEAMIYDSLGQLSLIRKSTHSNGITYYEKAIKRYKKLHDKEGESQALRGLGLIYQSQGAYEQSIEKFEDSLLLSRQLEDHMSIASVFNSLGKIELSKGNLENAKKNFQSSIEESALAQKKLGDNQEWQITFFEGRSDTYRELEYALVQEKNSKKALEVSESRRSLALNLTLANNLALSSSIDVELSFAEMQSLAEKYQTTFIVYSIQQQFSEIFIWVVSSERIEFEQVTTESLENEFSNFNRTLNNYPFYRARGVQSPEIPALTQIRSMRGGSDDSGGLKFVREEFKKNLARWYDALIFPLVEKGYLPKDPKETITLVLDGFLTQLPFALFIDEDDKYLIEKYPITTIPSLKTLQLMFKKTHTTISEQVLVMGNPDTGNPDDHLPFAEIEANSLKTLFQLKQEQVLGGKEATPLRIAESIQKARLVFLSCHGLDKKRIITDPEQLFDPKSILRPATADQYSVFEGCLHLAPDKEHSYGYLDSKEISELRLNHTDFVCLSACFSGTGGLWQEGSIGLVRSFIAAGAQTVMAAYWKVADSQITVSMVEKMATNLIAPKETKLTHPQALQQIMKEMIEEHPDHIEEWGAFFLTGINILDDGLATEA